MDLENFKGTMSKLDLGLFVARIMRVTSLVDTQREQFTLENN